MLLNAKRVKQRDGLRGRFLRESDFQMLLELAAYAPNVSVTQPTRYASYEISEHIDAVYQGPHLRPQTAQLLRREPAQAIA